MCELKNDYTGVPKPPLEYALELKAVLEEIYKETIYPEIGDIDGKNSFVGFDEKDDFIRVELSLPSQDRTAGLPDSLIKKVCIKSQRACSSIRLFEASSQSARLYILL